MNTYIEISIRVNNDLESDVLVARLANIGFEGFEEEKDQLLAFIPETWYNEKLLREVVIAAKNLEADTDEELFLVKQIEPRNWNEEWEKDFNPVVVDDFCAIRAGFHQGISGVQHEIVITPKMSFGTGHHATTLLMIEAMRNLDFYAEKVLDFGTGTGVLAILAEKMGSVDIRALDMDSWSVENALENIAENQAQHISLEQKDSLEGEGVFDVILANISLQVILGSLPAFWQHLEENGVIIASGVLQSDEEKISRMAKEAGFLITILSVRDNWMSFSLKKQNLQ